MAVIAIELASAYVSLGADTRNMSRDVKKALGQVEGTASSSGQGIGSKLASGIGKTLKAGALTAGAGAAAAIATSLTKGFQRLDAIEQAQTKFEALGYTAKQQSGLMDDITASVTGTAFATEEAADAAAMALAGGIKPGEELTGVLKTVGDSASFANKGFSEVAPIFTQAINRGKVMGDTLARLEDNAIPATQALAESMGKTAEEIQDMASKGEISFEDLQTAMDGTIGGQALKAGDTFQGSLANIGAAMGRLGQTILKGPFNAAPGVFSKVSDGIDVLNDRLGGTLELFSANEFSEDIGEKLGVGKDAAVVDRILSAREAVDKMRGAVELFFTGDFTGGIREKLGLEEDDPLVGLSLGVRDVFADWGERVGDVFSQIGEMAKQLAPSFGSIALSLGKAVGAISAATWEALLRILEALVPVLERVLVPALEKLAEVMEENPGLVKAVVGAFVGFKVLSAISGPVRAFTGTVRALSAGFGTLKAVLAVGGKGSILTGLKGFGAAAGKAAPKGGLLSRALGGISRVGSGIAKFLPTLGKAFTFLITKINPVVAVVSAVAGALTWFFTRTETGKKVFEGLKDTLETVWNWIRDTFVSGFERAGEILGGVWDSVSEGWGTVWEGITDFFSQVWESLKLAWETMGQPVVDLVKGAWDVLSTGLQIGWNIVKASFEVLWTALGMIWESVGQPIVDFVVNAFNWLKDRVVGAFETLKSGWEVVTTWLGEKWQQYGQPIIDWVVNAFNSMRDRLSEAWDRVKEIWNSLWNTVRSYWDSYGQPVVDTVVNAFNWFRDKIGEAFDKVKEFAQGLIDKIREKFNEVVDTVSGVKDRILDAVSDAGEWLWETGKDIIRGIWEGIKSMGSWLKDKITSWIPDWVTGPFEDVLDINSPSRVFADYGVFIGQGLANGIESMGKKVEDSVQGLADRVAGVDMPTVQVSAQVNDQGLNVEATASNVAVANPAPTSRYEGGAPPAVQSVEQGTESFEASSEAVDASVQATFDPAVQQADLSMTGFGANVQATATGVVTPQWQGMANNVASAAKGVIDPAFGEVQAGLSSTGARFAQQTTGVMTPMWNAMGANVARVRQAVTDPAMDGIRSALSDTGEHFTNSVNGTINPVWSAMGNHVKDVKDGTVLPVFNAVEGGLTKLSGWFGTSVDNIGTAWDRLRAATARPAKFVVETVMNNGIRNAWNAVADLIDEKKMNPVPLGTLGGYATGGILPGYTPGRDVHQFVSPSGLHIGLSGGEAIMRPEVARALGTSGVDSLNSAARMGGVGAVKKTLGGFAGGGVVESISGLVRKHFPMMTITSTYRNSNDHHGAGRAVDFSNGTDSTPEMRSAAQWFYTNYGKGLLELIHSPFKNNVKDGQNVGDGFGFYGAGTMNGHRNHVHVAAPRPLGAPKDPNFVLAGGSSLAGFAAPSMEEIAKDAWDAEIKKIPKYSGGPGMFDSVPSGYQKKATSSAWKYLQKKAEASFGAAFSGDTGGAGVERWRGLVRHILGVKGLSKSLDNTTLRRMNQESGGNPRAINNWDINAVNGTPSKGLMQVIDPTFRANADPGFNSNIWDPESNIRASMNYALRRYGSLPAAYDRAGGYDSGGYLQPGVTRVQNDSGKPEPVFSHKQWRILKGNIMSAAQAGDLKKLQVNLGVVANGLQEAVAKLDWQEIFGAASKAFNEKFFDDQAADVRSVLGIPDPDSIPAVKAFAEFRENEKKLNEEQAQAAKESREAAVQSNEAADKISAVAPVPVKAQSESVSVGSQVARTGALVSRALANPNPVSVGAAAKSGGDTIQFIVRNEEAAWSEYRKFQAKNSRGRVGAR